MKNIQSKMIQFVLMVNKQGQTRLSKYFQHLPVKQRSGLEAELIRRCLVRHENLCSFFEHEGYKVIYRRYASLYFIIGVDNSADENEMGYLEFIHTMVETLDRYFENICELDIMFNLEKTHFILDEMIANGCIIDTNKVNILSPLQMMDKHVGSL
jgi:AP-4 complex subunit sigma-1